MSTVLKQIENNLDKAHIRYQFKCKVYIKTQLFLKWVKTKTLGEAHSSCHQTADSLPVQSLEKIFRKTISEVCKEAVTLKLFCPF